MVLLGAVPAAGYVRECVHMIRVRLTDKTAQREPARDSLYQSRVGSTCFAADIRSARFANDSSNQTENQLPAGTYMHRAMPH